MKKILLSNLLTEKEGTQTNLKDFLESVGKTDLLDLDVNNCIKEANSLLHQSGYSLVEWPKTFDICLFGNNFEVVLLKEMYAFGENDAILVIDLSDGEEYSPFTVNIPYAELAKDEFVFDANNGSKEVLKKLLEESLITKTNKSVKSGFVDYPIYKFTNGSKEELFKHNDILLNALKEIFG